MAGIVPLTPQAPNQAVLVDPGTGQLGMGSLSDQVTFSANAADTLQLVVGGLALTLGTGDNATINIDKVQ